MAHVLRQEARPLSWDDLDAVQRRAVKTILELMEATVGELRNAVGAGGSRAARRGVDFSLDRTRSSRLVFLSGDRGTGKTTVLLSVRSLCKRPMSEKPEGKIPGPTWLTLRGLAPHLVWLEPLDMETMPKASNLMAAILARIDAACDRQDLASEVVGRRGASAQGRTSRGLLDPGPEYHRAMLDLQRLQWRVALAWEGNLPGRGGGLDSDSYAMEVIRSEKARISLGRDFNDVLEGLAEQAFDRRREPPGPLFILPVDDADLNPAKCLELLRILRFISVPRLFAIVLGDVAMIETAFSLGLAGEVAAAGGAGQWDKLLPITLDAVKIRISELAGSAMRKLIPVGQSIHLKGMTIGEALEYEPRGDLESDQRARTKRQALADVMKRCPVELSAPVPSGGPDALAADNLYSFLMTPGLIPQPGDVKPKAKQLDDSGPFVFEATHFLEAVPRRIADLWQRLQEVAREKPVKTKAIVVKAAELAEAEAKDAKQTSENARLFHERANEVTGVICAYCRGLISEDTSLSPGDRDQALRAVAEKEHTGGEWRIDSDAFLVEPIVGFGSVYSSRTWVASSTTGSTSTATASTSSTAVSALVAALEH